MKVGNIRSWCNGLVVLATLAMTVQALAQIPRPIERLGRLHGVGWGDGYHACKSSGICLTNDLPPKSATKLSGNLRGNTFYDHFDRGHCDGCDSTYAVSGRSVMDGPMMIQPPVSQSYPSMQGRVPETRQPTPATEPKQPTPAAKPKKAKQPKPADIPAPTPELPETAEELPTPAQPKMNELPVPAPEELPAPAQDLPAPNELPAPANLPEPSELPAPANSSFNQVEQLIGPLSMAPNRKPRPTRPAGPQTGVAADLASNPRLRIGFDGSPAASDASVPSFARTPIRPRVSLTATPRSIEMQHPGNRPAVPTRSRNLGSPARIAATAKRTETPQLAMPAPLTEQLIRQPVAKRRPQRLGAATEMPGRVAMERSEDGVRRNPFVDSKPVVEMARQRSFDSNAVIYQPATR